MSSHLIPRRSTKTRPPRVSDRPSPPYKMRHSPRRFQPLLSNAGSWTRRSESYDDHIHQSVAAIINGNIWEELRLRPVLAGRPDSVISGWIVFGNRIQGALGALVYQYMFYPRQCVVLFSGHHQIRGSSVSPLLVLPPSLTIGW